MLGCCSPFFLVGNPNRKQCLLRTPPALAIRPAGRYRARLFEPRPLAASVSARRSMTAPDRGFQVQDSNRRRTSAARICRRGVGGQTGNVTMRVVLLLLATLVVASCGQSDPPPKGDRGEVGPAGPAGPPGGTGIRMITAPCQEQMCAAGCNDDEQILNAYAMSPGGIISIEDERRLTFKPRKNPTVLVLACIAKR